MAQDTTPAIVIYQGDGSNRPFSVPFDKGDYGEIRVAFVRRGLTEYEYNPTTYSVGGHLYAWALKGTDPVRYYYTKDSDNKVYDANNEVIKGITVESMFDSSAVFSDGKTGYRARAKDIVSHALVEWLGKPLTTDDWICIVRETTTNQPYTYPNNQKHVENALDNLSRQIQELKYQVESSLKVDPTYTQDPNKLDPIDWLNTIVRSNDGTARNLKYHDMWLEYSTDDPDFPEKEKDWIRLLNTINITAIREHVDEGTGKVSPQYSKDGGITWIDFTATVQHQIDKNRADIEKNKTDIQVLDNRTDELFDRTDALKTKTDKHTILLGQIDNSIKDLYGVKVDKDQGKINVGKVLTVGPDGMVKPKVATGAGGGIIAVAHDDTLIGAGTDEYPLGVKDKTTITIVDWE